MLLRRQLSSRLQSRIASALHTTAALEVRELPGKGRGVIALQPADTHTTLVEAVPMAALIKGQSTSTFNPAWEANHAAHELLARADLSELTALHEQEGRKFPLLIAQMLAALLAELKATGALPQQWEPLEHCFAELHAEAWPQVEKEHAALLAAFESAGLANRPTLELFLPLARYRRLLGAAQLNAFELTLAGGAAISALLPGVASCFNHSCEPNVLVSCGETARVAFVAGQPIAPGDELCISYLDTSLPGDERRELLLGKYGFDCDCAKCTEETRARAII